MRLNQSRSIPKGITFSVQVEDTEHACLIATCALKHLYAFEGTTLHFEHVYHAYKTRIHGVAKQLILDGQGDALLILKASHFH